MDEAVKQKLQKILDMSTGVREIIINLYTEHAAITGVDANKMQQLTIDISNIVYRIMHNIKRKEQNQKGK